MWVSNELRSSFAVPKESAINCAYSNLGDVCVRRCVAKSLMKLTGFQCFAIFSKWLGALSVQRPKVGQL